MTLQHAIYTIIFLLFVSLFLGVIVIHYREKATNLEKDLQDAIKDLNHYKHGIRYRVLDFVLMQIMRRLDYYDGKEAVSEFVKEQFRVAKCRLGQEENEEIS